MFDPTIGRWLEEDPEGFQAGDQNLYRYVSNDPTNATDPSGLVAVLTYRTDKILVGEYGSASILTRWDLSEAAAKDGLIYQKVNITYKVFQGEGNNKAEVVPNKFWEKAVPARFDSRWYPYLELWKVSKGKQHSDEYETDKESRMALGRPVDEIDDALQFPIWAVPGQAREARTYGEFTVDLEAVFVEGTKQIPEGFKIPPAATPPSGTLPVFLSHDESRMPKKAVPIPAFPTGMNVSKVLKRKYVVSWTIDGVTTVKDNSDPNKPIIATRQKPYSGS